MSKLSYHGPSIVDGKTLEEFMSWVYKTECSDITFQSEERIMVNYHGEKHFPVSYFTNSDQIEKILELLTKRPDSKSALQSQKPLDFTYIATPDKDHFYRFRCDAVAGDYLGRDAIQISCRRIPEKPPTTKEMSVEDIILNNIFYKNGLILVSGATGSGKSSLIASLLRYILEDPNSHKKIITFEDPIEYVFQAIKKETSTIFQTEIYKHLIGYHLSAFNSVRRTADIVFIGEIREGFLAQEVINLSLSGHLVMSTFHANGVMETVRRFIGMLPESTQIARTIDFIKNLRMIVGQQLVPKIGGGRIPIREILVFNDEIKTELITQSLNSSNLLLTFKDILNKHGLSFSKDAFNKFKNGLISKEEFIMIAKSSEYTEEEATKIIEPIKPQIIIPQMIDKENLLDNLIRDINKEI
jgi:defect in organelle trafficking protein DotB